MVHWSSLVLSCGVHAMGRVKLLVLSEWKTQLLVVFSEY